MGGAIDKDAAAGAAFAVSDPRVLDDDRILRNHPVFDDAGALLDTEERGEANEQEAAQISECPRPNAGALYRDGAVGKQRFGEDHRILESPAD